MNANDLIADIQLEPSWTGEERTILLRALRLLAAAEGGEGTADIAGLVEALGYQKQCDEDGVMCIVSRQAVDEARTQIAALAARVAELEKDAERLDWAEGQWADGIHIEKCAIGRCSGDKLEPAAAVYVGDEFQATTIRAAIDAARSKP